MLASSKTWLAAALMAALFLLCGCSQPSSAPSGSATPGNVSTPASAPEPVTAKTAYLTTYKSAYKWAPDIVLLGLTSKEMPGYKNEGGKAGMWQATYASPSKHEYRIFTYAVAAHEPDIYKGVSVGNGIPWRGPTRDVMPIQSSEFNIDSDAAYTTAAADAEAWLKKNPDKKLTHFDLGNGYSFPAPVWYLVWGDEKSGGYAVFVNATTGKVLKKK